MDNTFEFQLHYFLNDVNSHVLDATIHNECEKQLISSIHKLQSYIGCKIEIQVMPKKQGGLIDIYNFVIDKPALVSLMSVIIGAWVNSFFKPAIHKSEETKNKLESSNLRLEIIAKIKTGDYSVEEIDLIIGEDAELNRLKSKYYKNICTALPVKEIKTETIDLSTKQIIASSELSRNNFCDYIIEKDINETKTTVQATIYIVAPVLVKGRRLPWRGIYIGESIEFRIKDKSFLDQVYKQEIKFGSGTSITCELEINIKHIKEKGIDEDREVKTFLVDNVSQWCDDESFQYYTKKYKRIKEQSRQMQLNFDDL